MQLHQELHYYLSGHLKGAYYTIRSNWISTRGPYIDKMKTVWHDHGVYDYPVLCTSVPKEKKWNIKVFVRTEGTKTQNKEME